MHGKHNWTHIRGTNSDTQLVMEYFDTILILLKNLIFKKIYVLSIKNDFNKIEVVNVL